MIILTYRVKYLHDYINIQGKFSSQIWQQTAAGKLQKCIKAKVTPIYTQLQYSCHVCIVQTQTTATYLTNVVLIYNAHKCKNSMTTNLVYHSHNPSLARPGHYLVHNLTACCPASLKGSYWQEGELNSSLVGWIY